MSSDPSPTAEIKVRAIYDLGRDQAPLLEIEEVEGIDDQAPLKELLYYAVMKADEADAAATESPEVEQSEAR